MRAWRRSEVKVSSCTFTDNLSQIRFNLCISVWTLHILWKEEIKSKVHKNYFAVLVLLSCSVKRCIVQSCIQILTELKVCKNNLLNVLKLWKCSLSVFFSHVWCFSNPHMWLSCSWSTEERLVYSAVSLSVWSRVDCLHPPAEGQTCRPTNQYQTLPSPSSSTAGYWESTSCRGDTHLTCSHTPHLLTDTSG